MNRDIRKISIGPDYKGGAMHYIVGQSVLSGAYKIHHIRQEEDTHSILIWIEKENIFSIDLFLFLCWLFVSGEYL